MEMRDASERTDGGTGGGRRHVRTLTGAALTAGALVLVGAYLLGGPLVVILLAGVMLLCPLLLWVPYRFRHGLDGAWPTGTRR